MSPPTAAHHSFACKLLVTQSVISCVQINDITTCKLAGCKRAPTLSTMALCSRDFLQFFWVVNFCYFLKTYLRKNWKLKNKIKFACKMCLSPKNCHFFENFKNWGKKKRKKSSGSNYYCFVCWPDWKTWVAFEIRMLPLLAFVWCSIEIHPFFWRQSPFALTV